MLEDGDSVRFGMCALAIRNQHDFYSSGYMHGRAYSYRFRSFVSRAPSGLSLAQQNLREKLQTLERRRDELCAERARLEREL